MATKAAKIISYTLEAPGVSLSGESLRNLEHQLRAISPHGDVPAYLWQDESKTWRSFDGRAWSGRGEPRLTPAEAMDYASWMLQAPADQIHLTFIYDDGVSLEPRNLSGVEAKAIREALGLTTEAFCTYLGLGSLRTLRAWEMGEVPIPVRAGGEIYAFWTATQLLAQREIANGVKNYRVDTECARELASQLPTLEGLDPSLLNRMSEVLSTSHKGEVTGMRWARALCWQVTHRAGGWLS